MSLPYIRATIDRASGLHELWMYQDLPDGTVIALAGPERWPPGWTETYALALHEARERELFDLVSEKGK